MAIRMTAKDRKEQLIGIALKLSEQHGYNKVTRIMIADSAKVTEANVTHILGTMNCIRRLIIRHAIKEKNLRVIAQGLSMNDKHAQKADQDLKDRAASYVANL